MLSNVDIKEFLDKISNIKNKNILVVGDIILDEYLLVRKTGKIELDSPVYNTEDITYYLGGSSNVAKNISGFGYNSYLCGMIGQDSQGDKILQLLNENNINDDFIIQKNVCSINKIRIIEKKQILRYDFENYNKCPFQEVKNTIKNSKVKFSAIIISDYNKGFCTPELYDYLKEYCNSNHLLLYVDSKQANTNLFSNIYCLSITYNEFVCLTDYDSTHDELNSYCLDFIQKYNIQNLIVKMNKYGVLLFTNGHAIHIPSNSKFVKNTVGAGDSFLASLVCSNFVDGNFEEKVYFSNWVAGCAIKDIDICSVNLGELQSLVMNHEMVV